MAFMGMRGSGDWVTDQRPKSWRETILYLYPNGTAPLTAILSKLSSEGVQDPEFYWWTQMLQNQGGDVAGVYQTSTLGTSYTMGNGNKGDTLYAKVTEDVADEFRRGHQVLLRDKDMYTADLVCKVVSVTKNGTNSSIGVKLLEADAASGGTFDYIMVIGNINAEGAVMPDPIAYDPIKWYNYTQIFRTPLSITRTARKTRLRTGDAYQKAKREALEYHSIEMEKALMFSIPTEVTGDNGQPERTTMGLLNAIKGGYSGHGGMAGTYDDFTVTHSGSTWLDKGEEWLDNQLEQIFRYGDTEKMAFVGSGALLGINRLVKNGGQFEYTPATTDYGIQVVKWTTPFGVINLKLHPLFSNDITMRNSMVIFEPNNLNFRYIDDTSFYKEGEKQNTGQGRKDATDEEYLTEAGLEYHHPIGWGYLHGVGKDG